MLSPQLSSYAVLFEVFVDYKILHTIAREQTQQASIAWEDAAQVAYKKLWRVTQQGRFRTGDANDYCHWAARFTFCAIIDYVGRRKERQQYDSLDQLIPGTNTTLLDTLVDSLDALDALDAIDQTDLLLSVVTIITELDRRYLKRLYLRIWQGLMQGKKQVQITGELKTDPSTISGQWKEVRLYFANIYPSCKKSVELARCLYVFPLVLTFHRLLQVEIVGNRNLKLRRPKFGRRRLTDYSLSLNHQVQFYFRRIKVQS